MSNLDINIVKDAVNTNLPGIWLPLEASLSIVSAAMLEDVDHCIGLIIVGEPGGRKTTTTDTLGDKAPIVKVHKFTPASFVSHDATKTEEELKNIDLLPQLKGKILVVPELAPLFGQRHEDLDNDISILTAVMDGKGYWSHTGVHGRRGYEGDYRFNMIGATTPLPHRAWDTLGKLSSRWIFHRLPKTTGDYVDVRQDFGIKKSICQGVVQAFIQDIWKGYGTVHWNRGGDGEHWSRLLHQSALVISQWRGLVQRQNGIGYNPPIIEAPDRLRETLYALARGHALLWGRKQINEEDVNFVISLNETNMPEDRLGVFKAFSKVHAEQAKSNDTSKDTFNVGISLREAARSIGCSEDKAERVLYELNDLGLIRKEETNSPSVRSARYYRNV